MKALLRAGILSAAALGMCAPALADYPVKAGDGSSITIFDYVIGGKHYGVHVNVDSTGAPNGVTGNPFVVSALALPLPIGAATSAKQDTMTTALGSPFQAGGSIGNTDFGADCDVVATDQAWTVGTQHRATCTSTGRFKVGLSSAATAGATASPIADLAATVDPSGNQQPLQSDAAKNLKVLAQCVTYSGGTLGSGNLIPCGSPQEGFQLAIGNVASAAATVFGGDYILDQSCSAYGTLLLQRLGPDGTTWITSATKTAADGASPTGITIGSRAQVRVTLSGTTGCAATLTRVPN